MEVGNFVYLEHNQNNTTRKAQPDKHNQKSTTRKAQPDKHNQKTQPAKHNQKAQPIKHNQKSTTTKTQANLCKLKRRNHKIVKTKIKKT